MGATAKTLFDYLRDVICTPDNAAPDIGSLSEDFQDFDSGPTYFIGCVTKTMLRFRRCPRAVNSKMAPPSNELADPLKSLRRHSSIWRGP